MRYPNIPEEELKIRVGEDYFSGFDHAKKIGKVDFCALPKKIRWIPFTEDEVGAKERFASSFMSDFIAGKIKKSNGNGDLFNEPKVENGTKCEFSAEAQAVFDAGKALWKYYHAQKDQVNVNASLYDIREHFQGRNEKGTMNSSPDERYTERIGLLREKRNLLADKIAEKVYERGFLM